jgi:predicted MFS family arabinose efflux permease
MSLPASFRRLAWSNLAAQGAEQMALATAPIVAVLSLGAGPAETGLLATAQSLPFLLLSLPAGVLADRMRRKRLMVMAELLRAAALFLLPILLWQAVLTVGLLAAIAAAIATGTVVYSVAAPALVPTLVDRPLLALANTRLELARSLAFAVGPSAAGVLVAAIGGGASFVIAGLLSLVAVWLIANIREESRPQAADRRIWAELAEGLRFTRSQPLLLSIMACAIAWSTSFFVLHSIYVVYAVQRLGLSADQVGMTLGAYGAGMLLGGLFVPLVLPRVRIGLFITLGPIGSLLGVTIIAASRFLPGLALPLIGFFVFGVGPIMWTIGQTTLRQALTPTALLGRVSALFIVVSFGARPIGAAIGGLIGSKVSLDAAMTAAVLGYILQLVIVLVSPLPRLKALPPHPPG